MDPFSHVAFGRTLAALHTPRARSRGTMTAVVLGTLAPDADAVLMPFGWDIYLRAHQIGTHSALGSLAIAALTAFVVRVSVRDSRFPRLVAAAWAGGLSHLALDILSGAQVGLGWPLIDRRISLPLVAMAEPVLIAIFCAGSMVLFAARKSPPQRQRLAAIGMLTVAFLFLGLKAVLLITAMSSLGGRSGQVVDRVVEARWASQTEWYVYDRTTDALQQRRVRAGGEPGASALAADRRGVCPGEQLSIAADRPQFSTGSSARVRSAASGSGRRHARALVGHPILLDAAGRRHHGHRCSPR